MGQVEAKQRIKVATKDHVLISKLHLRLHRKYVLLVCTVLFPVALAIFIAIGIAQPNVESEWKVTGLGELKKW